MKANNRPVAPASISSVAEFIARVQVVNEEAAAWLLRQEWSFRHQLPLIASRLGTDKVRVKSAKLAEGCVQIQVSTHDDAGAIVGIYPITIPIIHHPFILYDRSAAQDAVDVIALSPVTVSQSNHRARIAVSQLMALCS